MHCSLADMTPLPLPYHRPNIPTLGYESEKQLVLKKLAKVQRLSISMPQKLVDGEPLQPPPRSPSTPCLSPGPPQWHVLPAGHKPRLSSWGVGK